MTVTSNHGNWPELDKLAATIAEPTCPQCGSADVFRVGDSRGVRYTCSECDHTWFIEPCDHSDMPADMECREDAADVVVYDETGRALNYSEPKVEQYAETATGRVSVHDLDTVHTDHSVTVRLTPGELRALDELIQSGASILLRNRGHYFPRELSSAQRKLQLAQLRSH